MRYAMRSRNGKTENTLRRTAKSYRGCTLSAIICGRAIAILLHLLTWWITLTPVSSYSVSVAKAPAMAAWNDKNDMEHLPITQQTAMEWTSKMENVDGTKGPHWTMEQTKQVMAQNGIECDPLEFNIAINMMYSDYVAVAKKMGVDKTDFYAAMAKAFLDDPDAGPDKLSHYYEYVVK